MRNACRTGSGRRWDSFLLLDWGHRRPMETIRTGRLVLRPLAAEDADQLFPLFSDWAVIQWLSAPPWPYEPSHMVGFVSKMRDQIAPDREIFSVITFESAPIGGISWRQRGPSHLQSGGGPNIGYWLGAPHWGKGYMTEAARALCRQIFATCDTDTIYSGAFTENAASLRVQSKLGFAHDGDTMLRSNPKSIELAHVNTILTRRAFEASNSRNPSP